MECKIPHKTKDSPLLRFFHTWTCVCLQDDPLVPLEVVTPATPALELPLLRGHCIEVLFALQCVPYKETVDAMYRPPKAVELS